MVRAQGTKVLVDLSSAGMLEFRDTRKKKKRLKRSTFAGGPGVERVPILLTGAGSRRLDEKRKLEVKIAFTFTPTGGTAATQAKQVTLKKPKPRK